MEGKNIFKYLEGSTIYFSKMIGVPIYNQEGKQIGKFNDFFVNYGELYPVAMAIRFKLKNEYFYVQWEDLKYFSYKRIQLEDKAIIRSGKTYPKIFAKQNLGPQNSTVDFPSIGSVILDKQIVDTFGKKVVRVNDIAFLKMERDLRIVHAGVGLRSMIRRLGFDRLFNLLFLNLIAKSRFYRLEKTINWKYVHAITDRTLNQHVKLNLTNDELKNLHPADLADILEDLHSHGREQVFSELDVELAAKTLSEVEDDIQTSLIREVAPDFAAQIIENMDTDEAVDLLNELSDKETDAILSVIKDSEVQEEIQDLIDYEEDSAGGLMTTNYFVVSPNYTPKQVFTLIRENGEEIFELDTIYVTDANQKLVGTTTLVEIIKQSETKTILEFMNTADIKVLTPEKSWEDVADYMNKYNLFRLPIVNERHELLGVISVDDILPWILGEN